MAAEPSHRPELRVVGCPNCERHRRVIDNLEVDVGNLQDEIKKKLRHIKRLEDDKAEKLSSDRLFPLAKELFDFWVVQIGKDPAQTELGPARLGLLIARLKGRKRLGSENPARDVARAILGAKHDAYVNPKGKRHDDLTFICRNEATLEDFIGRYERWKEKTCSN